MGRKEAYGRVAHFLCEMLVRLKSVGLARDHACEFPITQGELADALGITPVHINRVLQELRRNGLISLAGGTLEVLDWAGLKQAGEFDPTYLHLEQREAAA